MMYYVLFIHKHNGSKNTWNTILSKTKMVFISTKIANDAKTLIQSH